MNGRDWNGLLAKLTSFDPADTPDTGVDVPRDIDWPRFVDLVERHGLAAIVSYQLDYRFLGKISAPDWVRERLLLSFNGLLNDNVHRLTQIKRLLSEPESPEVILLGGAAAADAFYPHIAFRPLDSIDVLLPATELSRTRDSWRGEGLQLQARAGPNRLTDGQLDLELRDRLPGLPLKAIDLAAVWSGKVSARPYGARAYRLAPEEALLASVAALAQEAFQVPRVLLIDLREMALRVQSGDGFWERGRGVRFDPERLAARARGWGLVRALCAATLLLEALFPEAAAAVRALRPVLTARITARLQRWIVEPALDPQQIRVTRLGQSLRRSLL